MVFFLTSKRSSHSLASHVMVATDPMPDIGKILSVQGISNTRVISDSHSKSPDLVIIIIDLSEVTVPDE